MRFPGGAAEGAGAERVCLSVRASVHRRRRRSLWLSGTHTTSCSFRLPPPGHRISVYGSIAALLFPPVREVTPLDAPVPAEEGRQRGIPVLLRAPGEFMGIMCHIVACVVCVAADVRRERWGSFILGGAGLLAWQLASRC